MTKIIPDTLQLAAKRGFIRTTFQAYAATLSGGLIVSAISLISDPSNLVPVITSGIAAVVTPPAAGLASYLSIISNGLPKEYVDEVASSEGVPVIGDTEEAVG